MSKLLMSAAFCSLLAVSAHAQTFAYTTLDNPADPTFNQLLGINDNGVIVGEYGSGAVGHPSQGYSIGAPYTSYSVVAEPGSVQTKPTGINNTNYIAGFWTATDTGSDSSFAFLAVPTGKSNNFVSAVDPLVNGTPSTSRVLGVNNSNEVAGYYVDSSGISHGYLYSLAKASYKPVKVVGSTSVVATGLNDNSQICGFLVNTSGSVFAFVQDSATKTQVKFHVAGSNTTQFLGINNSGIAVGFYIDSNNIAHGVYYTSSTGQYVALDDPNAVNGTFLRGINNANQLVGYYVDGSGNTHGMLVTVTP